MTSLLRVLIVVFASVTSAFAQNAQNGSGTSVALDGSPAPVPPESITRDARRRATVRAIKLTQPLRVDGKLDEEVYQAHAPFGGFIQVAPKYGAESTEKTDVWVTYDGDNIYVSARCWDSASPERW